MNVDDATSAIHNWASSGLLQQLLAAAIILIVTSLLVHLCTRGLKRLLSREGSPLPASSIFINIVRVCVWLAGIGFMLATCFEVDVTAIIATLGVGGVALSLGLKDTIANLIGGIQVSIMGLVKPGDNIRVGSLSGIVRDVTWRHTVIVSPDGREVIIPNSVINSTTVEKLWAAEVARLSVFIRPGDRPMDEVCADVVERATAAAASVGEVAQAPKLVHGTITEYGASSTLVFAMESSEDKQAAVDAVVLAIADVAVKRD